MARRARLVASLDLDGRLESVQCPTLVITGEASLDRVVPVTMTREYLRIWPHATDAVLERTGHLGPMTRPDEFARLVASFADQNANRTSTVQSDEQVKAYRQDTSERHRHNESPSQLMKGCGHEDHVHGRDDCKKQNS
jgi:hypothetical protein